VRTGLQEAINFTEKGAAKLGEKIDQLETSLKGPIAEATNKGAKVTMAYLEPFVNEAKKVLGATADPLFSEKATTSIDRRFEALKKMYPEGVPADVAQQLKINTYQLIKKAYGKLSTSAVEYQKQVARGLKEGIVDAIPEVGNINKRLRSLYAFETQFEKSFGRIKNLNMVSLGGKVLAAGGGVTGKGLALVHEIFGSPAVKTFGAIQMNRLGELLAGSSEKEVSALRTIAKVLGPVDTVNFLHTVGSLFSPNNSQ
jgi:hypothetical protein